MLHLHFNSYILEESGKWTMHKNDHNNCANNIIIIIISIQLYKTQVENFNIIECLSHAS